jgi:hypothetical protein
MKNIETLQKEILKLHSKNNFLQAELNQIKLMLEGKNIMNNSLKKALKSIKIEIKYAFEDLEKHQLEDLFATLMQISEITNNVYLN